MRFSQQINTEADISSVRNLLSEIIGVRIGDSTTIFAPFYTNFGRVTSIGKNVSKDVPANTKYSSKRSSSVIRFNDEIQPLFQRPCR